MTVLGAVRDVYDHHLVVSLPNQLTGTVRRSNIADVLEAVADSEDDDDDSEDDFVESSSQATLSDLFKPGQLVFCSVIELDNSGPRTHVQLSLDPAVVNALLTTDGLVQVRRCGAADMRQLASTRRLVLRFKCCAC